MKIFKNFYNESGTLAVALRITIIYAILGSLWIAYSDKLLITIFEPDAVSDYARLQTLKGWFFILMTSVILYFLIWGNIKKLKKSEQMRRDMEAKYLRAQRMESIGTLSSGIAHDLNNILAPILLGVETLRKNIDDKKRKRVLHIIESSAKRGTESINQILSFSKGIHGEQSVIDVRSILREISEIISATFPKSIQLKTNLPDDIGNIAGNATQIHQALLNICVNARDAMPNGGTLRIEAANINVTHENENQYPALQRGSYTEITITDTGSGIPDEIKDKLLDPFFTTKEEGKGTGLGLPTVDYIMKNHNGQMKIESQPGQGSTFTLYFPTTELIPEKEVSVTEQIPMGSGQRLLLIEDEAALCEMISEVLQTYNYEVLVARDGAEGLATYRKYKDNIDLVLTDGDMPLLGGEQLINALHETNRNVKIFITTGSKEIKEGLEHLHPPIVGYLEKPYATHSLLKQLHQILT